MRVLYRDRRETLLTALSAELPEVEVGGISAGLHATVRFPRRLNEGVIIADAKKRDMGLIFMRPHYLGTAPEESTLLLSYANMPEAALRTSVRALATIVKA